MRVLVTLTFCVLSSALNGCMGTAGTITIHPLSEVTTPTFCRHYVDRPEPIMRLHVSASREIVWQLVYAPESPPALKPGDPTLSDLVQPPKPDATPVRPFSCITYGRPPPGYREKAPAPPLIPDKWYTVLMHDSPSGGFRSHLRFIIRSDSRGTPIKLEYHSPSDPAARILVISPHLNTTEVTK